MTAAGVDDSSTIRSGGSSTVTTVNETNDKIREMAVEDYNAAGDGGDSDEEGDGFEVVESMAECTSTHERATNDHDEIEANVSDSIDNCVYSNVTDALPEFVTLDGAPEGWVPPKPNEKYNPNATLGPGEPRTSPLTTRAIGVNSPTVRCLRAAVKHESTKVMLCLQVLFLFQRIVRGRELTNDTNSTTANGSTP